MMSDLESLGNEFLFVIFNVSRFNWKEKKQAHGIKIVVNFGILFFRCHEYLISCFRSIKSEQNNAQHCEATAFKHWNLLHPEVSVITLQ